MVKAYCIYGPPGTGKTTELLRLLGRALEKNDPSRVGFFSHTRAAAREAVERLEEHSVPAKNVSTLHSLCYRTMGVTRQQVVTAPRLWEFGDEVNLPITGKNPDHEDGISIGDEMLQILNYSRATCKPPLQVYDESSRPGTLPEFKMFIKAYDAWKKSRGFVDFDDMLTRFTIEAPDTGLRVILIDEAQDLSRSQWAVVHTLQKHARVMIAAGDDDQAIYCWGGANPYGMLRFEEATNAQRKILGQSYRVPRSVHRCAEDVIGNVPGRVHKEYAPRPADGSVQLYGSWDTLVRSLDPDRDTLLLYRDQSARRTITDALHEERLPYHARSGQPSPTENKYATAIRGLGLVATGGSLDRRSERAILSVANQRGKKLLSGGDYENLARFHWSEVLEVPAELAWYYEEVPPGTPTKIHLSTIHASKGREAELVVLDTHQSRRVEESMARDPDPEHRVFYVGVTRAIEELRVVDNGGYRL